jgi:hypothetical protein
MDYNECSCRLGRRVVLPVLADYSDVLLLQDCSFVNSLNWTPLLSLPTFCQTSKLKVVMAEPKFETATALLTPPMAKYSMALRKRELEKHRLLSAQCRLAGKIKEDLMEKVSFLLASFPGLVELIILRKKTDHCLPSTA